MNYETFIKRVIESKDIFSVMVEIFDYISVAPNKSISGEYASFCEGESSILHEIRAITDILPIAMNADFNSWKNEWLEFLGKNKKNSKMISFQTLKNIDDLIPEILKKPCKLIINHGPLNEYELQDAFLYISPPNSFFDKYFKYNKIRVGRQTVLQNVSGLNTLFKQFFIIKKSSTNDYIPVVQFYSTKLFSGDEIRIGCCPFNNCRWFDEASNPFNDTFDIKYEDSHTAHNQKIIELIELFDLNKVDIVTFPELSLNQSSLRVIKDFLLRRELKNVKLICTGSLWFEQKNEAYILSKDGTILLSNRKKKPYQRYDKKRGKYISENIVSDPYINFLDISGVGRMSYNICLDYNSDDVEIICSSVMMSNLMIVAAFSNNMHLMEMRAVANASLRGTTTILTNACAAAESGQLISCIVKPVSQNRQLTAMEILSFRKEDRCCSKCEFCIKTGIISTKCLQY